MTKEIYVIKFGDMYLAREGMDEYISRSKTTILALTDDVFEAIKYEEKDLKEFEKMISYGGQITELSYYEINQTFSIEKELETDEEAQGEDDSDVG